MVLCGHCFYRTPEGECTCPKLYEKGGSPQEEPERSPDHLVYWVGGSGGFWVGEAFGCVHGVNKKQIHFYGAS